MISRNHLRLPGSKFFPRQHGKKPVPARRTSINGHMQQSPQVLQCSFAMFRGNPLQIEPAAPPAMHVAQISNGHAPRKKTRIAIPTTPRPNFRNSINIVRRAAPPRPLAIVALALRTNQRPASEGIRAPKNMPAVTRMQYLISISLARWRIQAIHRARSYSRRLKPIPSRA